MRYLVFVSLAAAAVLTLHSGFASDEVSPKQLEKEIYELFAKKDYASAAQSCRKLVELEPSSADAQYNLACALARTGEKDGALAALSKSIEFGFSDVGHMNEDDDLTSIRTEKTYAELIEKAREKEKNAPFEKGAEIPGTKIVENLPDGGLRYRVRMSPTETEKPARLIVWLHPSGGSMNNVVEALSPLFIKRGFALVVMTRKQWAGWTGPEQEQLLNKTLPDVGKIKGITVEKPILLGFSAGGQAALTMWQSNPDKFSALILDAAYPIDTEQYAQGKVAAMQLPKNDAIKTTPIFAICGSKDGGTQMWTKVRADWLAAGIPLTLKVVPDGVHQWLFGKSQIEDLSTWLEQVAAGKFPADAAKEAEPREESLK